MDKSEIHFRAVLDGINKTDAASFEKACGRLDSLAKPPGSLGVLEETAAKLCAVFGTIGPDIGKRCVIVFASDNGVISEGVSAAPQSVTTIQTMNILNGVTGVSVLAKLFNAEVIVADIGINAEIYHPDIIRRKIRRSTNNIAVGAAMSLHEAEEAVETGIELVKLAAERGFRAVGVGEMGIGNTTTASAVLAALLGINGKDIAKITGRGAGLDDEAYERKIAVINRALDINQPVRSDVMDIISKVGGFDICAMAGAFIGAAYYGLPAVIDGFISTVAALCAVRLNPTIKEYIFASHLSHEKGCTLAFEELSLSPPLHLEMRLGEGSGCPIMFGVMDAALCILKNMATFGEADISASYVNKINGIAF